MSERGCLVLSAMQSKPKMSNNFFLATNKSNSTKSDSTSKNTWPCGPHVSTDSWVKQGGLDWLQPLHVILDWLKGLAGQGPRKLPEWICFEAFASSGRDLVFGFHYWGRLREGCVRGDLFCAKAGLICGCVL